MCLNFYQISTPPSLSLSIYIFYFTQSCSLLPSSPLLNIFHPYPVSVSTSPINSILFYLPFSLYMVSPISSMPILLRSISLRLFILHPYPSPSPFSLHYFLSCPYHSLLSFIHITRFHLFSHLGMLFTRHGGSYLPIQCLPNIVPATDRGRDTKSHNASIYKKKEE